MVGNFSNVFFWALMLKSISISNGTITFILLLLTSAGLIYMLTKNILFNMPIKSAIKFFLQFYITYVINIILFYLMFTGVIFIPKVIGAAFAKLLGNNGENYFISLSFLLIIYIISSLSNETKNIILSKIPFQNRPIFITFEYFIFCYTLENISLHRLFIYYNNKSVF